MNDSVVIIFAAMFISSIINIFFKTDFQVKLLNTHLTYYIFTPTHTHTPHTNTNLDTLKSITLNCADIILQMSKEEAEDRHEA